MAPSIMCAQAWSWVKYGRTEPNIPGWQEVRGIIGDAMTAIINGADVLPWIRL